MSVRKKIVLVYPKFQLQFMGLQFLVMAMVLAIVAWGNHQSFAKFQAIGEQLKLPSEHPYFRFIQDQSVVFHTYLYLAFALGLCVSSLLTLFLSHRLAGPIVRTKTYLDEIIAEKKLPENELQFRKGDFFDDLPEKINGALQTMNSGEYSGDSSKMEPGRND